MTLRLTTSDGVPLELLSFDGKEQFMLVSPRAYAPGQPMLCTVQLTPPCSLDVKSIGSKLRDDGSYDIRVKAISIAKPTRERILAALAGG
jgi:hypothetical protein